MKKKIFCFICVLAFMSSLGTNVFAAVDFSDKCEKPSEITAQAVYMVEVGADPADFSDDTILYKRAAEERMYPASITKVMTAAVVLDCFTPEQLKSNTAVMTKEIKDITFSEQASVTGLIVGKAYNLNDLFHGMMINSGADCTLLLAEACYGAEEVFVEKMNEKAAALGLSGTHFTNTTGLQDEENYSTAKDLVTLGINAMYIMQNHEYFSEVVGLAKYTISDTENGDKIEVFARNDLISSKRRNGINGIKTGTTSMAGDCLLTSYNLNDMRVIAVTLHADSGKTVADNRALYDWFESSFELVSNTEMLGICTVPVLKAANGIKETQLEPRGNFRAVVPKVDAKKITLSVENNLTLTAPFKADTEMAFATASLYGQNIGKIALMSTKDVTMGIKYYIITIAKVSLVVFLILIVILILPAVLRRIHVKSRKHRQRYKRRRKL